MTRRIRAINKGRLRIWWVHHGQQARLAALVTILLGLIGFQHSMAYEDEINMERAARAEAEDRAEAALGFGKRLPRVTFVIEARTQEELRLRLAEIAGEIDCVRAGCGDKPRAPR